jgi:hypothetical protein
MADKAIEVLLDEKRNFSPPKKFKKSANVRSERFQYRAQESSSNLGQSRQRASLVQTMEKGSGVELAVGQVVCRWKNQRVRQLS